MKILGLGVDVVKVSRFSQILEKKYCQRLLVKMLHQQELDHFRTIEKQENQAQYLASRWAVKEAVVKAMGRRQLVFSKANIFKDLEGKPFIALEGKDNQKLIDQLKITRIHISLSHQKEYAAAMALVEVKNDS